MMVQDTTPTLGPQLIAHRGYPHHYPENTLLAIRKAIEAGARFVEVDVQMSADYVPVLHHDANLKRTTGRDRLLMDLTLEHLRQLDCSETDRLGPSFRGLSIPTLHEFVRLVKAEPGLIAFVEIKRASLKRFGSQTVVNRVMDQLPLPTDQFVIISFDRAVIELLKDNFEAKTGWVIEAFDDEHREQAERLSPDFVFCNQRFLPDDSSSLWAGPWRWAIYCTQEAERAIELGCRGAHFVETNAIGEMLEHPLLMVHSAVCAEGKDA